ncbi:MAG: rubredoxin-NAD+ reductase [Phenylobacterium sp.]|jgi:rubredoxin-NAD+ reductase
MDFDIIIIGSGLGGYNLVKEFRRLNTEASILMICADDGRYYSKPMLSTGFAKNKSATDLMMKSADDMAAAFDITIYCSTTVEAIDKETRLLTVDSRPDALCYEQALVFATGAAPIDIPLPRALENRCFPINDLQDYDRFRRKLGHRKHVTIIGSGLVGTEYSNDLIDSGMGVDVIALDNAPLQLLLPPPLSEAVQQQLAAKGINWHFNASISDATLTDGQVQLTLSTGETIHTDQVLSAIGLRPRTTLAEQAGLTVNRGIVVDKTLRTNVDNIYALGDCAEIAGQVLMYVAPLTVCAKALAKTLTGTPTVVQMPAAPVIVKTPACPVVSNPARPDASGEWIYEGQAPDLKATFVSKNGALLGFALTGKKVVERMKLAKQLPALIN